MALLEMKEEMLVGISNIDNEVKELLLRINELDSAIKETKDSCDIEMIASFLESYVVKHFKAEEALMEKVEYPDLENHREEHQFFKSEFLKINESLKSNKDGEIWTGAEALEILLRDWMAYHLTSVDSKLADFLKGKIALQ